MGPDAVGAVVTGTIVATDPQTGLTAIAVGSGRLNVSLSGAVPGAMVRVQLLSVLTDRGDVRSVDLHALARLQLLDPALRLDLDF